MTQNTSLIYENPVLNSDSFILPVLQFLTQQTSQTEIPVSRIGAHFDTEKSYDSAFIFIHQLLKHTPVTLNVLEKLHIINSSDRIHCLRYMLQMHELLAMPERKQELMQPLEKQTAYTIPLLPHQKIATLLCMTGDYPHTAHITNAFYIFSSPKDWSKSFTNQRPYTRSESYALHNHSNGSLYLRMSKSDFDTYEHYTLKYDVTRAYLESLVDWLKKEFFRGTKLIPVAHIMEHMNQLDDKEYSIQKRIVTEMVHAAAQDGFIHRGALVHSEHPHIHIGKKVLNQNEPHAAIHKWSCHVFL